MFFNGKTNSGTERVISRSRRFRIVSTGAFCALAILTLLAVFPIAKHKEDAEATTVPATTSLSIISSKDTASVDITPTSKDGTFAISAAADQAEFSVTTDNLTGYSVTLLGSDTSGQLVNNITGDTLDTITSNTTESDFRTGSASTYANKWGYRLNVNNTTTTDFMAAPTSSTAKTIYSTNAPNTTGTSDNFTLALGARVDYEKQTGTYTNTFVLTAVGNPISYQIDYIDNYDGTATVLEQDAQSNITASEFIISATNPTRSGAIFKGWCYGTIDHTTNPSTCTGTTYQSGDTFTFTSIPSTGTATANLYAIWEMGDTMQSFTPELCRTRASSGDYTLRDSRDGNEYTVRWINGNCWMTQNLRTTGTISADQSNFSGPDFDVSAYSIVSTDSSYTGHCDSTNGYNYACAKDSGDNNVGVYYNFYAASAGTISTNSNTIDATQDICPAGWKLPSYSEMTAMTSTSGATTNFNAAVTGYYIDGEKRQNVGVWWTSTSSSAQNRYQTQYDGSSFVNSTAGYRSRNGFSIRCIMRQTMQKFSSQDAGAMAVNETKTLEDERDGQIYTVKKFSDGNVWMIRNLAIGCNGTGSTYGSGYAAKTLTSADSNVSTDYTTSTVTVAGKTNSYDDDYITCNSTYGAYYNYAAASAKTITGSSNTNEAEYSICPKGWRLPNSTEVINAVDYGTQFSPIQGGRYYNGTLGTSYGIWWSSTNSASQDYGRYLLMYNGTNMFYDPNNNDGRGDGIHVRCIKDDSDLPVMQNISQSELDSLMPNTGDTAMLKDNRDGGKYKVSKLADGNIWMLDNLALDLTDSSVQANLTESTTNASTASLTNLKNNVSSSWADAYNLPKINTASKNTTTTNYGAGNGKVGIYYNFCAASAGSYCYASGAGTGDASEDVCPSGWRMPTSGATGEYQKLYEAYGSNHSTYKAALSTPLSGYIVGGTTQYQNTYAVFWSSTRYTDGNYMHDLGVNASGVTPQNYGYRYYGFSVRCIKDDNRTVDDITYMQQINPQIVTNTATEVTYTLKDARDNKDYTVAKLLDGQLWMTSDLNLAGGTTLNASTSDVPTDNYYTLPASNTSISTTDFYDYTKDYVYNSGNETTDQADCYADHPCNSYYSWRVATAGGKDASGTVVTSDGYNAAYSMCPRGWRLPTSTTSNDNPRTNSNWKTGDYYRLITSYGVDLESSYSAYSDNNVTASNFDNNAGPGTIPNFLRPGYYYASNGLRSGGSDSNYWSSTNQGFHDAGGNYSYLGAYYLNFKKRSDGSYSVNSALVQSYANGFPVRCMAR
ncbi:hypothetical protein IKG07_03350 [Candidatus Saccharibacteria bacterium]|nr:hypothetical protein [Candidatus Saccharibacteria bacterium]